MFWGKWQEPYLEIRDFIFFFEKPYHKISLKLKESLFGIVGSFYTDTYKPKVMTITMIYKTCAQV
jgi:hypothetical protein